MEGSCEVRKVNWLPKEFAPLTVWSPGVGTSLSARCQVCSHALNCLPEELGGSGWVMSGCEPQGDRLHICLCSIRDHSNKPCCGWLLWRGPSLSFSCFRCLKRKQSQYLSHTEWMVDRMKKLNLCNPLTAGEKYCFEEVKTEAKETVPSCECISSPILLLLQLICKAALGLTVTIRKVTFGASFPSPSESPERGVIAFESSSRHRNWEQEALASITPWEGTFKRGPATT